MPGGDFHSDHWRSDVTRSYPLTLVEVTSSDMSGVRGIEPTYAAITTALTKVSGAGLLSGVTLLESGVR